MYLRFSVYFVIFCWPPNGLHATIIHRSECRRDGLFKATDREKILTLEQKNVIHTATAEKVSVCAKKCTSHMQGRSFNYKKTGNDNCQILDINKTNGTARIESASGWIHYEPVKQIGPRCRLVNCASGYQCKENCSLLVGYECFDINECDSSPCQNGATCNNLVNKYTCTCVAGYTGVNCQTDINECSSNPCQNGATCNNLVNKYTCTCVDGYTGVNCETDINECSSNPCQNGATCTDRVNSYTCNCVAGYAGTHCETNINECSSSPCQNGGTCSDQVNSYSCTCASGYGGTNCETDNSCRPYSWLTESFRAVSFYDGSATCDDSLATGWYRFGSPAGTQMITSPPSDYGSVYRCRTHAIGYLVEPHPSVAEGEVTRKVCFAWSGNTCWSSISIKVLNCGDFYIYYLAKAPSCHCRYCGNL